MSLLDNIFADPLTDVFTLDQFLLVTFCGLFVGAMIGVFYAVFNKYSESFVSTVALLPAVVAVVILVVNDNIGMGIAVAGAFALIRFRSAPGKAKEIGAIFLSMGAGLLVGGGLSGIRHHIRSDQRIVLLPVHAHQRPLRDAAD